MAEHWVREHSNRKLAQQLARPAQAAAAGPRFEMLYS
jgi:hypothetical protein